MGSAVLAMDQYEVVDKLGFRYQITKLGASEFAAIIAGAQKRSNWVRCVDPLHTRNIMLLKAVGKVPTTCGLSRAAALPSRTKPSVMRDLLARWCTLNAGAQHSRAHSALLLDDCCRRNPNSYPNPNSHYGEHARVSKRALPLQL